MPVLIKRNYDAPSPGDGYRVLVDRLFHTPGFFYGVHFRAMHVCILDDIGFVGTQDRTLAQIERDAVRTVKYLKDLEAK